MSPLIIAVLSIFGLFILLLALVRPIKRKKTGDTATLKHPASPDE
jgi:hypothetical protein